VFEKYLVPVYLPRWIHAPLVKLKRLYVPPAPPTPIDEGCHVTQGFTEQPRVVLPSHAKSITGGMGGYLDVCRMGPLDSRVFADFRRNPSYTEALEHVSEEQGREYLRLMSAAGRARRNIVEAAKNDDIGNPATMCLDSGLMISPTTLRYLKVADDVEKLFGSSILDGADVVEIGVGYGGQCRILDSLFKIKSYTLVDLKPVLNLAGEFLSNFPLRCTLHFLTMNELSPQPYDFALSNYALTELSREVQEVYFAKALEQSRAGYITYNDIAPAAFRPLTCDELCQRLGARKLPEQPLTHPKNCIIIWGGQTTTIVDPATP
jgi:putative sugar O-methyltransferase